MNRQAKKELACLALALGLLGFTPSLHAFDDSSNWRVELRPSSMRIDAREYLPNGALFNREQGRMDAWQLELGYRPAGATARHWETIVLRDMTQGRVDYIGLSQGGLPVVTQTQLQMARSEVGLQRHLDPLSALRLSVGATLGTWEMNRNILPGLNLPLQELLRERTAGLHASALWRWPFFRAWAPESAGVRYSRYWHHASSLRVNSFGVQDLITLSPGPSRSSAVSAQVHWRLSERHELLLNRSVERLDPAASETAVWTREGVPTGTVRYPGAAIDVRRFGVGMRWVW